MRNFFSKIKNGIQKIINNIKSNFVNIKNKIKNIFLNIKNKIRENKKSNITNSESVVSKENINNLSNERQRIIKNTSIPVNNNLEIKTTGQEAIVTPIVISKSQNNNNNWYNSIIDNIIPLERDTYSPIEENNVVDSQENEKRIVSISIKEQIGIVEFKTTSGEKYQKDIEDILNDKKNIYKNWNINKKCNEFAKNKIQGLRLRRRINPVIISTLDNEEDIDNYIKCVRDTEKIWFDLQHDLIDSKLKGKNARLMKRASKYEEKIGAKVNKKESLIEKMLKKFKSKNKNVEEMMTELKGIVEDNNELNKVEEELENDINQAEGKEFEKEKMAKKEFKERYASYVVLVEKLYSVKPRKKLSEIMGDVVNKDLYNLTDKDALTRAIATFNVGHRLAMIKQKESKKYLISALEQFSNEELLNKNRNVFQYLEDTLLNLQYIYIRENNFREADRLNQEYMRIVERERVEKFNPKIIESRQNGLKIKEIDLLIEYRKKYVAGQKAKIKLLFKSGHRFEAEKLYRDILDESGIILTDEAYDLSKKENCIENGKYIVIANGITYREPILGNEKYLLLRRKLAEQAIKDKMNSNSVLQPVQVQGEVKPKIILSQEEQSKKKGIFAQIRDAIDEKAGEKAEKEKKQKELEARIRKQKEEEQKREEKRKAEEEKRKAEEEKRKAEEERKKEEKRKAEEEKRKAEEERKKEEKRKAELADFNKRYNDYNILARGLVGGATKRNLQDIKKDIVHNDIYNMTSEDEATKGVATFRVGHRLATLPGKKKEAEKLLKSAISILKKDEVLSKDETLIGTLENSHLDLGNLYLMNGEFKNAEKSFVDYMETVKKEKIERYDPKIIEARTKGLKIIEINHWIEYKSKLTIGKKAMIRLLCKAGKNSEAEELYKRLLEDSKILLSNEEYKLSLDTNCIENGQYMRIMKERTYRKPITGTEYLLRIKEKNAKDIVKNIQNKYNSALEK